MDALGSEKEAVYFAFPFAMTHPQFQYEIQNGVVDPAKDMYPGAARTDAAALSRMGWEESTPLEHDQISSQDKALDRSICLGRSMEMRQVFLPSMIPFPPRYLEASRRRQRDHSAIHRSGRRAAGRYDPFAESIDKQDRCDGCNRTGSEADRAGGCTHFQNRGSSTSNSHGSYDSPVNLSAFVVRQRDFIRALVLA